MSKIVYFVTQVIFITTAFTMRLYCLVLLPVVTRQKTTFRPLVADNCRKKYIFT